MANQIARIGIIFNQVETTTNEIQDTVVRAMGRFAYSQELKDHTGAAETADQAVAKAIALLEQLRELRSALREVTTIGY
jgi:hypothetical protein